MVRVLPIAVCQYLMHYPHSVSNSRDIPLDSLHGDILISRILQDVEMMGKREYEWRPCGASPRQRARFECEL